MNWYLAIILAVISVAATAGEVATETEGTKRSKSVLADRKAIASATKKWGALLTDEDYNATRWQEEWRQPQNFFEHYNQRLSDTFLAEGAKVNFALVGACDGTNDRTIKDRYIPLSHWRGVFVEPFEMNFQDLVQVMEKNGLSSRSHLIHGACTNACEEESIKMKRPTFEEKNKSLPHWMRREIGTIVPKDKLDRPATGGWTFEYVKCYTGETILKSWEQALYGSSAPNMLRVRPHVLKVDVEGHDYQVLMSFIGDDIPPTALPLLVSFEAKSIKERYNELRAQFEKRGYVVSHMANDGFALLRAFAWRPRSDPRKADSQEPIVTEIRPDRKRRGKRAKALLAQDDAQAPRRSAKQ